MVSFFTNLINGLSLGSIYAIIAIGYTMVYGIAKMLNFAHGDIIMIGAYISFTVITTLKLPTAAGILAAILGCMCLGITIEKVAYKPLRHATSSLAVLITAIGVSYFLQNIALLIFSSNPKMYTSIIPFSHMIIQIGAFRIQTISVVSICVSVLLVILLQLFINKTRPGQAMLACAQDRGAASLMGISVDRTISMTFAIGSAMAGIAGVLLCSAYPTLSPYTGAMPGIKAFVAAVFGGIGSIPGAMIGGLLLGIIEILSKSYISSQLSDAIVFSVLIIVLLVKPTGIMGKVIQEKV
ncbi:MAG: branched-chain amino acid ABC transporter permease [Lachnospiraceae bacterium]|nr:branched-chain amino acid ABC transporter permease [Lachnospiraceae bacterium]